MTPWTESFTVRSYESGINNHVTLPTYCNYLQEAAGNHARALGVGIHALQDAGFSWMLSRLHLEINRYLPWRDTVVLKTWPSGMKGRLTAVRDFEMFDAAGAPVLRATSEWLYVDLAAQKITRLPEGFAALAPEGTPHVTLEDGGGKFATLADPTWRATLTVRASDHDFNNHVNNVHYIEWALEALPETVRNETRVAAFDIVFRSAAHAGDVIISEARRETDGSVCHLIRRESDNAVLATARAILAPVTL